MASIADLLRTYHAEATSGALEAITSVLVALVVTHGAEQLEVGSHWTVLAGEGRGTASRVDTIATESSSGACRSRSAVTSALAEFTRWARDAVVC